MNKNVDTAFYKNQAQEFLNSYESDKAVIIYKRLIGMAPKVHKHHYYWARIRGNQEKYQCSELKFRETIILEPQDSKSLNNLGRILLKQDKYNEAISVFQRALKISPKNQSLLLNLAITLTKKGDYEEALEQYGKALEVKPSGEKIHNAMGYLWFLQGRETEAILKFNDAIKHGLSYEMPYFNRAMVLFCQARKSGMEEKAKTSFEFGIQALTGGNAQKLHTLKASVSNYNSEMNRVTKELGNAENLGSEVRGNLEKIKEGLEYILGLLVVEIEKLENL